MKLTRSTRRCIPNFSLYGENVADIDRTDPLHIEDIPLRSRKYLWRIGTHRHTGFCQLVYVTAGAVLVDLEETREEFVGPVVVVIPSGAVHGFRFVSDTKGYVLTTDLDWLLRFASAAQRAPIATLFSTPRVMQLGPDRFLAARTELLFAALLQEFRQANSRMAPVSGWLACSALWVLSTAAASLSCGPPVEATAGQDLNRLRRFKVLVELHYLKHWPVERYAVQLAVSESSLNRLCRALTAGSAFDVIQQRLALEARRRLAYLAVPVAVIAAELGFKDPAYFGRFFRKHSGMSPTQFLRHQGGIIKMTDKYPPVP